MWPVRRDAGLEQEAVCRHVLEHDVLSHELCVLCVRDFCWVARGERVVLSAKVWVFNQNVERSAHLLFHGDTLVLEHGTWEREVDEVSADTNSHRERREAEREQVELAVFWDGPGRKRLDAPVVDVLGILGDAVVAGEDLREERFELIVVRRVHCVAAHGRVWVLETRLGDLEEGTLLLVVERVVVVSGEGLGAQVVRVRLSDGWGGR